MEQVNWGEFFLYDAESGKLTWKVKRPGPKTAIGMEAGSVKHDGRYRSLVLFHKRYYSHRVIWEMVNGSLADGVCIDHVDGNGLNNRIENLRAVSLSLNQRNRKKARTNTTGIAGVYSHKGGFSVHCANKYLTYTKDFFEACCARKSAELRNEYHPNHGRMNHASN